MVHHKWIDIKARLKAIYFQPCLVLYQKNQSKTFNEILIIYEDKRLHVNQTNLIFNDIRYGFSLCKEFLYKFMQSM